MALLQYLSKPFNWVINNADSNSKLYLLTATNDCSMSCSNNWTHRAAREITGKLITSSKSFPIIYSLTLSRTMNYGYNYSSLPQHPINIPGLKKLFSFISQHSLFSLAAINCRWTFHFLISRIPALSVLRLKEFDKLLLRHCLMELDVKSFLVERHSI